MLPPLVFGRARGLDSASSCGPTGDHLINIGQGMWRGDDAAMLAESHDEEQIIARVAALDIGKAELVCCVRLAAQRGPKRLQEVSTHSTMTRSLTELASRLVELGVQRVVMEATSDYWKPVFYLLEAHGLDPWLVNARDVKHLPGRPKSDVIVEKLLEDACIKLSVVASDIFGVSGRAMMAALIAGERDPHVLAQMARARMRTKIARLEEAFNGHFDDHHRFLLARMLDRIDSTEADIAALDNQIEAHLVPFAAATARLDEIPGIGPVAAAVIIAEVGVDMSRFPTAGHLCSWAKLSPGLNTSAGKTKGNGSTGHGNRYLAGILGEAAVVAGRTDTFLGARYRRIAKRRGNKRAIVAVGRSILVIIWHLLASDDARFTDLGADHFTKHLDPDAKKRNHIRQLEALGYTVTLTPAA